MELDSITKQLNKKFSEPLPEFYKRRIVIWNDEDGDFSDKIGDLKLDNAKIIVLKDNNNFAVKRLLTSEDLENNYLIYNPYVLAMDDDWLLDIKLYSDEFRADQLSMWMQEMGIVPVPAVRNELKRYKQYLNAANRRKVLSQFGSDITNTQRLHMAILASILRTRMNPKEIIKSVIRSGNDLQNKAKADLLTYGAASKFWILVNNTTGFNESSNVDHMDSHIVLSAVSHTIPEKVLAGMESRYSAIHSPFCYEMLIDWIHSDSKYEILNLLRTIEKDLRLEERFKNFDIDDLSDTEILPIIDEVILGKMMKEIMAHTISADSVISVTENRRTMAWYELFEDYYKSLYWAAKAFQFADKHVSGFHLTEAYKIWNEYCNDYYLMDSYYRHFYMCFNRCLTKTNTHLDDGLKNVANEVEKLYKNWYLNNLSHNWTNVAGKSLTESGMIPHVEYQEDFYKRNILSEGNKVFVIISDAMRYEVAASLAEQLRIETKSDVTLNSQQAVFPTITKFGMAALLPHRQLSLDNKNGVLRVLADGKSTEANNRETVLKAFNDKSISVKYKDLLLMKRDDRRNLIKGMEVIYIYHDTIDHTSHHDEQGVFNACDKAVEEIKNLVKIITNELNGINVVITADHGFIYTYEPLSEDDKLSKAGFENNIIELDRRHVISDTELNTDFLIQVKGFYNDNGYRAYSPRENIRIKGSGSLNFVHGGASLQELVVPVVQYKHLRSGYKSYELNKDKYDAKPVTVALLSSNRKVSNMIFNLSFYQKEAVVDNYVPCTYRIFLVDSEGNTISDIQKIVADRTSNNVKDREYRCTFNLKQQTYDNHATYYLMIQDEDGLQVPVKEEMQIDIAISFDDFNFFDD